MRIVYYLLITLITVSCRGQIGEFDIFKTELKVKSLYFENEKKIFDSFTITKPLISDSVGKSILDNIISKEMTKEFCDNNDCEVNIKFELGHFTSKLISLKENVHTMFRLPRDIESINFYNFLIYENKVFKIKLNRTVNLDSRIKSALRLENAECKYLEDKDILMNLFIDSGNTYIHLYKDEVCNIFVKLKLNSADLSFNKIDNW